MTGRAVAPTMTPAPAPRAATRTDLATVERLLGACALPLAGVAALLDAHPADVLVVDDPASDGLLAMGALEVHGAAALLRSVAVRTDARHLGLGALLVHALRRRAAAQGVRALYLLTTTAEPWFPRFGFTRVERSAVPADIGATVEFQGACPDSAAVMMLDLDS